jgi:CRP-like cAMP-binding protein
MAQNEEELKLSGLPLLEPMPDEARRRVARLLVKVGERLTVPDGQVLIRQGDLGGEKGFALLDGNVVIEPLGSDRLTVSAPALLGEIQQFNPRAQRTATVRASGPVIALRFFWQDFYARAKEELTQDEQNRLMDSLEYTVCQRLACDTFADYPILGSLGASLCARVSIALHWIAQRINVPDGSILFEQNSLCGAAGYLLAEGTIQLQMAGRPCGVVTAPNVIGVMPAFDAGLRWSATAIARGPVQVLKFSWLNFMAMLEQRLSTEDLRQFTNAVQASAGSYFAH